MRVQLPSTSPFMPDVKPKFDSCTPEEAIAWARDKYNERKSELLGTVPTAEMFLMALVEIFGSIAISLDKIANKKK
jgi:hypothetical protein